MCAELAEERRQLQELVARFVERELMPLEPRIIERDIQAAETTLSAGRSTDDLTAYDLYLRGYAMALSSAARFPEALRLMEQAIARDQRYGPALA
jgi:hypothetical protein